LRKAAKKYMKEVKSKLKELTDFTERHASYLNAVTDDAHVEMLLDMEPTELDLKVVRNFRTYLKQGESNEAYFATPAALCELLSQLSKVLLYLTPQKLSKQLKQAGYKSEVRKAGKHKVRFFYVELVK
jgi:predicted anti-sigma-YlaC factor YlaD